LPEARRLKENRDDQDRDDVHDLDHRIDRRTGGVQDYSIVEPDGTVTMKADDVKSVTDKKFLLKSATMSDFKCRMPGDSHAVVTAALKMSGSDDGKEFSGDYRALDVFEKKDGKWMAVASQLTKVGKE
jgi:Domain of unknown function (DUF4440)